MFNISTLDRAMTVAYNQTRDWMMSTFDLTEDQAITGITATIDFGVTQASQRRAACPAMS